MTICFIIDNLETAGAQVHLTRLLRALLARDINAHLVVLGSVNEALLTAIPSLHIHRFRMGSVCAWNFFCEFMRLKAFLAALKPDLVHTYLNTANVFGGFAARWAGVRYLIGSRRDMGHFRSSFIGFLERKMARHSDCVVCVSNAVRESVIKSEHIPMQKTAVIYSGVDTIHFLRSKSHFCAREVIRIGQIATMDRPIKGHRFFIKAAAKVLEKRKDIKFILVGDGPLRLELEKMAVDLGIDKYLEFRGTIENVSEQLCDMDIYVQPSLSEGFSNAVLEAMAMSLPVVAFAVEGNLEIIDDGNNGCLANPGDVESLADKMLWVMENPQRMLSLGHNARRKVEDNFSLDWMVDHYIAFYNSYCIP